MTWIMVPGITCAKLVKRVEATATKEKICP
jgi:hypothetical protein